MRNLALCLSGAILLVFALGCGGSDKPTGRLSGRVTLDGKPIEIGSVQVVSEDGKAHGAGAIGKDGAYEVPRAPVGKIKLAVLVPQVPAGPPAPKGLKAPSGDGPGDGPSAEVIAATKAAQKLPRRYAEHASSGLATTIQTGDNTFDLELFAKPRPGK
jgi:hypothetical protein